MGGDSTHVVSMVDFWMGEWTKGHLVHAQLPHHLQTKQAAPQRNLVGVWLVYPQKKVMYKVKQHSKPWCTVCVELTP